MPLIPTTQRIADQNLARLEGQLGQSAPIGDQAFLRVLAALEAVLGTSLFKFGIDRANQDLAVTATGEGLDALGNQYSVIRNVAVAANLEITLPGTNGTVIPATVDFVGDSNGVRYGVDASVVIAGGIATLNVTARDVGTIGNLANGETLTIGTQIAGAETIATVTDTLTTGAEGETDDVYRLRVLDVIRAPGGGGNAADYRNWSQEVAGVARAYPFAGNPVTILAVSSPPDRTVYIESTVAIDADGIPPSSLLDQVRDSITTDPVTGLVRQPLGLTDETLFVEPIIRTAFFVEIIGLVVDSQIEAAVKAEIETQLTNYFLSLGPFVDGIDPPAERNDLITDLTVSNVVQDVLSANGATATGVLFEIVPATPLADYLLAQNETAKLSPGGVTYV